MNYPPQTEGPFSSSLNAPPPRPAYPLLISIYLHCSAVAVLLVFRLAPVSAGSFPARYTHVTLLAPALARPLPRRVTIPVAPSPEPAAPAIRTPRRFEARLTPVRPPVPENTRVIDLPLLPQAEARTPWVPAEQLPSIPAPALRTDNFAARVPVSSAVTRTAIIVEAGFSGPAAEAAVPRAGAAPVTGLFGGTQSAESTPGDRRVRAPGTFGSAELSAGAAKAAPPPPSGAFGDISAQAARRPGQTGLAPAAAAPVEILYKPKPVYTEEARRSRIEGEVLVEVEFRASGEAHVVRLVRGLGHGLDEAALNAARSIRFRPATRAGVPVDSTATIHILFELAY